MNRARRLTESFIKYLGEDTLSIGDDGREEAGLGKNGKIDGKVANAGSNAGSGLIDNVLTRKDQVNVQFHDRCFGICMDLHFASWSSKQTAVDMTVRHMTLN